MVQTQRTPSKHLRAARARCVELCQISSGWFNSLGPKFTRVLAEWLALRAYKQKVGGSSPDGAASCVTFFHFFFSLRNASGLRTQLTSFVAIGPKELSTSNLSEPLKQPYFRERHVCTVLSQKFGMVQAHRTSLHPLKQHDLRPLSYKFGVVQAQ